MRVTYIENTLRNLLKRQCFGNNQKKRFKSCSLRKNQTKNYFKSVVLQ